MASSSSTLQLLSIPLRDARLGLDIGRPSRGVFAKGQVRFASACSELSPLHWSPEES